MILSLGVATPSVTYSQVTIPIQKSLVTVNATKEPYLSISYDNMLHLLQKLGKDDFEEQCSLADLERVYDLLAHLAKRGPECQAFDDAVCDFFDEGDPILDNYKSFGITDAQYKLLKRFRKEFKAFCDENDFPQEFIATPEWERIMNLATDVLKSFNYKKK